MMIFSFILFVRGNPQGSNWRVKEIIDINEERREKQELRGNTQGV